jgi:hypothetical protein
VLADARRRRSGDLLMESQREWTLGTHRLRFEPPDVLLVEYREKISLEDATRVVDVYRELSRTVRFFLLVDLSGIPLVDAEIQRYFSEHADPAWLHANIIIGARLGNKAVARGIFLASHLTGRSEEAHLSRVQFVSTQAEAYELMAWLRARPDRQES